MEVVKSLRCASVVCSYSFLGTEMYGGKIQFTSFQHCNLDVKLPDYLIWLIRINFIMNCIYFIWFLRVTGYLQFGFLKIAINICKVWIMSFWHIIYRLSNICTLKFIMEDQIKWPKIILVFLCKKVFWH